MIDYQDRLAAARHHRLAGDPATAGKILRAAVTAAEDELHPDDVLLMVLRNELAVTAARHRGAPAGDRNTPGGPHNPAGPQRWNADAKPAHPPARHGSGLRKAGPDPAGLTRDRAALAVDLGRRGRHAEARLMLAELLEGGAPRYDIAVALHDLASSQFRRGDVAEAATTLRRALVLKSAELGRHHPDLAVTLHNLACCLQGRQRRRQAHRYLRRAVAILDGAVAPDHPTLLACRHKLAQRP